jgi:hypothetical protein
LKTILLLSFWLIFTLAAGYGVLRLLFPKNWPFFFAEGLALFFGTGIAAVSIQLALLSFFGIKFSVFSITVWWVPIIAASTLVGVKNYKKEIACLAAMPLASAALRPRNDSKSLSLLEKFFIGTISFEVLYVFFRTLIQPMESYDSIAIYALKSKIFYLAKMIPHDFSKVSAVLCRILSIRY